MLRMSRVVLPVRAIVERAAVNLKLTEHRRDFVRCVNRVIQIVQIRDDAGDVVRALVQGHDNQLADGAGQISIVPLLFPLPQSIRRDVPFGAHLRRRADIAIFQQNLADFCRRIGCVRESGRSGLHAMSLA